MAKIFRDQTKEDLFPTKHFAPTDSKSIYFSKLVKMAL